MTKKSVKKTDEYLVDYCGWVVGFYDFLVYSPKAIEMHLSG